MPFTVALAALLLAAPVSAQVVETPQPFDSAARLTRLTPAVADSLGLRPPTWPVSGAFVLARLYRQSSGGYVLVVERPDGTIERLAMLDEAVTTLRMAVDRSPGRPGAVAVAAAPTAADTALRAAPSPAVGALPATRPAFSRPPGAASIPEVMGSQVLLGALLYGPLASSVVNSNTDDATLPYLAYLASVGGAVMVGTRLAERGVLTRAQNTLATHMAVHGAAAGAALTYAAGGSSQVNGGTYAAAALAGSIGGSAIGMLVGRSLDPSEAAASALMADLALLDGYLFIAGSSDPDRELDVTRGNAGFLVGVTAAGYAMGPFFGRAGGRTISTGDAVVLALGSGIGMLGSLAVVGDDAGRRRTSYALLAGGNIGVAAADLFFARRFDYKLREGGLMAAVAGAGALAALQFPGVSAETRDTDGDGFDETIETNERRALAFATAGSLGGVLLLHRALRPAPDRGRAMRVGQAPEPAGPASRRRAPSLTGLSIAPDVVGAGRVRLSARVAF